MKRASKRVAVGDTELLARADAWSADRSGRGLAHAAPLYRAAYRRGEPIAAFNLACTYQNVGRYRDAVRWFRRALAAGEPSASMELARAELYGLGTRRNVRAAFARLARIAKGPARRWWPSMQDRIDAMLVMADALMTGWPVRRDHDEAVRWLRRAARLGSDVATAMLQAEPADAVTRWNGSPPRRPARNVERRRRARVSGGGGRASRRAARPASP